MILTKKEILKKISKREIVIQPFSKENVGPASVDLALDNELRVFKKGSSAIDMKESSDYRKITKTIRISKGYILKPGELVIGLTKESIKLPDNIAGMLQSRSRFARFGLMSHATAPFVWPGADGKQALEIYNAGPKKLKLIPGTKICQIVFTECKGKARYEGIYKRQKL